MDGAGSIATNAPAAAEIIARARAMISTLAARSLEARRRCRIADETIAEMQRAGLFRVLQPKRWGGYEMDLPTFYEIQFALAQGDMSTAWIYGVSGVHPWFMALLEDRAADGSAGQRQLRIDLLLTDARRKSRRRAWRVSSERALEICELLRTLPLGAARRHGRHGHRRSVRGAHLLVAAGAI